MYKMSYLGEKKTSQSRKITSWLFTGKKSELPLELLENVLLLLDYIWFCQFVDMALPCQWLPSTYAFQFPPLTFPTFMTDMVFNSHAQA